MVERGVLEHGTGAHTRAQTQLPAHTQTLKTESLHMTHVSHCLLLSVGLDVCVRKLFRRVQGHHCFCLERLGQAVALEVQHLTLQNVQGSSCDQCARSFNSRTFHNSTFAQFQASFLSFCPPLVFAPSTLLEEAVFFNDAKGLIKNHQSDAAGFSRALRALKWVQ